MRKLVTVLLLSVILILSFAVLASANEPVITATGASVRIPDGATLGGLRFKMTVETPLPQGVEIVEQGTLIIPFYVIGENELTLDTSKVRKIVKTENKYYSYKDSYYEFTAVLTGIPVYNLKSPICARGYITYTADGGDKQTVYSDTVIYDIYSIAEKIMASSSEKEETKTAVDSFIIESYNEYATADSGNAQGLLSIVSPAVGETVYPYLDQAKNYLLAGEAIKDTFSVASGNYVKLTDYKKQYVFDVCKPIEITWTNSYPNVGSYTVMYATKADFSDAEYAYASASANKVEVYNLYKATDYYVKVIANIKDGTTYSASSTFKTADLGPRVIHLDGSCNARDLGGYMTSSGERTLQGLLYRSGQMDTEYWNGSSTYSTALTAYGKYTASKELGLIADFDFRAGSYSAAFPGATRIHVPVGAYNLSSASNKINFRKAFSVLANINNYPLIFHCQGGADRTGTMAYLLNALLGVSEIDIVRDYEFTSFSVYSNRTIDSASYIAKPDYGFFTTLDSMAGNTLQEKAESYFLSIGVTAEEIANFKSIMFTGRVPRSVTLPTELKISEATELKIEINGDISDVSGVYVGGEPVEWYVTAGGIAVSSKAFHANVTDGTVALKLVFNDGETFEGTFEYDSTRTISIDSIVSKAFNLPLEITVGAVLSDIEKVFIDDEEVIFRLTDTGVKVAISDMPSDMTAGNAVAKVLFSDGAELEASFDYDMAELVYLEDYIGNITLTTENNTASSRPVGYGKWVRMTFENTYSSVGDTCIFIGSYGIKLRSSSTRYHTYNTSGTIALDKRPSGHNQVSNVNFKPDNNYYLYMKVDVSDTQFTVSLISAYRDTGEIKGSQVYTDARLTTDEFTSEQAAVTFVIGTNSDTTKLVIYGGASDESTATFPESVSDSDNEFEVLVEPKYATVSSVYIGNTSVNFTETDNGFKVLVSEIPDELSGNVSIKAVLSNGEELSGSFYYSRDSLEVITVINSADYINFNGADSITIVKGDSNIVSSPIGYGKWIKLHCNVEGAGDNHIYIGSYGVRLRGGFRIHSYSSTGVSKEVTRSPGLLIDAYKFTDPYDVYMKVEELSDAEVKLWFKVCKTGTDTVVVDEESYKITRIADEIPSEQACLTYMVSSQATEADRITVYND